MTICLFVWLPDYFCALDYESWLQTDQGSFSNSIILQEYCVFLMNFYSSTEFSVLSLCSFSVVAIFHTSCVDLLQLYYSGIFLNSRIPMKVAVFHKSPFALFTFSYKTQLGLCIFSLLHVSSAMSATMSQFSNC